MSKQVNGTLCLYLYVFSFYILNVALKFNWLSSHNLACLNIDVVQTDTRQFCLFSILFTLFTRPKRTNVDLFD